MSVEDIPQAPDTPLRRMISKKSATASVSDATVVSEESSGHLDNEKIFAMATQDLVTLFGLSVSIGRGFFYRQILAEPVLRFSHGEAITVITLTHWGQVMLICISKLTIIGSDNGLAPVRCEAIIWTNDGILLIGPLGTNFSQIWIKIYIFSFKKMHLKMSPGNGSYFVSTSMC